MNALDAAFRLLLALAAVPLALCWAWLAVQAFTIVRRFHER